MDWQLKFTMNYRNCNFIILMSCKFNSHIHHAPWIYLKNILFYWQMTNVLKCSNNNIFVKFVLNYTLSNFNLMEDKKKSMFNFNKYLQHVLHTHEARQREAYHDISIWLLFLYDLLQCKWRFWGVTCLQVLGYKPNCLITLILFAYSSTPS